MPLLGELGVVQRRIRRLEIGAAVLLVGIEEQRIEPAIEIVMARHIGFRPRGRIELLGVPDEVAQPPLQLGPARQHVGLVEQDGQRVGDRAVLDHESAFHVDFAERKLGIEQNPPLGVAGQEPHRDRLAGAVAAGEFCPARGRENHRPAADELPKKETQQAVHRNHPNERSRKSKRPRPSTRRGSKLFPAPCENHNNAGTSAPVWDVHNADIRMSGSRHCVICALPFTG